MTPKQVLAFAKENECKFLDVKFQDFLGLWQHYTRPIQELDESTFENGYGFDGSSIRGWQSIESSDMLMLPDPATAMIDPTRSPPNASGPSSMPTRIGIAAGISAGAIICRSASWVTMSTQVR